MFSPYPKKHWCDNVGWGMAKAFHTMSITCPMQVMKLALDKANVFILSCDEVISIDNKS
jgi:hypothetical protein